MTVGCLGTVANVGFTRTVVAPRFWQFATSPELNKRAFSPPCVSFTVAHALSAKMIIVASKKRKYLLDMLRPDDISC
jgi:hypothetical protein